MILYSTTFPSIVSNKTRLRNFNMKQFNNLMEYYNMKIIDIKSFLDKEMEITNYDDSELLDLYGLHLYEELRKEYGSEYHNAFDDIMDLSAISQRVNGATVYKELGVNQGCSLSWVMLNLDIKKVIGVDKSFRPIREFIPIFKAFAEHNDIDIDMIEGDSVSPEAINEPCDILYIDTVHNGVHLMKELEAHHRNVSTGIVMHDTNSTGMKDAIYKFIDRHQEWSIFNENDESVGSMSIYKEEEK